MSKFIAGLITGTIAGVVIVTGVAVLISPHPEHLDEYAW